jgi:hypothetical protein
MQAASPVGDRLSQKHHESCMFSRNAMNPLVNFRLVKKSPTRQNARFSRGREALDTGWSTELSTDRVDKGFYLVLPMAYPTLLPALSALFRKCHPQAAGRASD